MSDLAGRVAVVTGCQGGIGSQICRRLAEAGAVVIGVDVGPQDAACAAGDRLYRTLDVTCEAQWSDLAEAIASEQGRLDILVHNAGVVVIDPIERTTVADWPRQMAVNADGPFLGTKSLLGLLRDTGEQTPFGSSVVVISSVAGLVGTRFSAGYSASKGAARLFAKAAAVEFAALGYNVQVNSVHPGVVQTGVVDHIMARYVETGLYPSTEEGLRRTTRTMGHLAEPDDIAKVVRFLASDEAGYMNGSDVVVDGGFTAS